jgi:glucose uptake protein
MILPSSSQVTLLLLILSMVCWGSWTNTQKLAGKWRFELYYYDFALGFLLLTIAAAYTLGTMNSAELSFQENFLITGYRNMAYAAAAGVVFNVGNMFLAAAVSVAGLSVGVPISLGIAVLVSTAFGILSGTQGNVLLSLAGSGLVLAALMVMTYAYSSHLDALTESTKKEAFQLDPRTKQARRAPRPPSAAKAVVLGGFSGIALGLFHPLVELAQDSNIGVAPYGLAVFFAGGILPTTLALSPFFFNFPVTGGPIGLRDYFRGSGRQHLLGLLGGILAGIALLASFLSGGVPAAARVAPATVYALSQSGALLAALWGLLVWRELKGASERVRMLFAGMLILYAAGITVLSVGQG